MPKKIYFKFSYIICNNHCTPRGVRQKKIFKMIEIIEWKIFKFETIFTMKINKMNSKIFKPHNVHMYMKSMSLYQLKMYEQENTEN